MAGLTHALLTEDEAVILEALEPSSGDQILAIFAYGNGDAGLALVQAGPAAVYLFDYFDRESLAAQVELKRWFYTRIDNSSLRGFIGIDEGFDSTQRSKIIDAALGGLSPASRAFWQSRLACLRDGMARRDSTAAWCRNLDRFMEVWRCLPSPLRKAAIILVRWLAPLYFPYEERLHSLGYRQLLSQPEDVLSRLLHRSAANGAAPLIPYRDFQYLSPDGHEAIQRCVDRIRVLDALPPPSPCNKIYLSNMIDYLSADDFQRLLRDAVPHETMSWRALLNSTYASPRVHPYLDAGLRDGWFEVDWDRTHRLRAMDRVGVYPGLTIIRGAAARRPPARSVGV